jgi:hypothetical protein
MAKKKASSRDPIMPRLLALYRKSGKTLDEVGLAMGYATNDPRLSMLRKFAKAIGTSVTELLGGDRTKKRRRQR